MQKAYDSVWTVAFAFYHDLPLEELKNRLYLVVVFNDEEYVEKAGAQRKPEAEVLR